MKVRITKLKAPWPAGSAVGHVVAFDGAELPAWAVGKCAQVADDTPTDAAPVEAAASEQAAKPAAETKSKAKG